MKSRKRLNDSSASRAARLRMARLEPQVQALESRLVMDSRTFGGLFFNAMNAFGITNGIASVRGPVTISRPDAQNIPLIKLGDGVSFRIDDATASVTAMGTVSGFGSNGAEVRLLNDAGPKTFRAGDLLSGGAGFDAAASEGVAVAVSNVAAIPLRVSTLRIPAAPASPALNLSGNLLVSALPGLSVPLPSNTFVVVDGNGVRVGGDFRASLTADRTFTKGNVSLTVSNVEASFSTSTNTFGFTGTARLSLPRLSSTVNVSLGSPGTPGIEVTNGALTRLNLGLTSGTGNALKLAGLSILPRSLSLSYQAATNTSDEIIAIGGEAGVMLSGTDKEVTLALGTGSADGIRFVNGRLTTVRAAVSGQNIGFRKAFAFQSFSASLDFDASSNVYIITGGASITFSAGTGPIDVTLGTPGGPAGLVITGDGVVNSIDLAVKADAKFGVKGLNFSTKGVAFHYDVNAQTGVTTTTFSGNAAVEFRAGGNTNRIDVTLGTEDDPGLVIETTAGQSQLKSVHAGLSASFSVMKLNIEANNLFLDYKRDTDTYGIGGQVRVKTAGTKNTLDVSATLGDPATSTPGIVVRNGELASLRVTVNGGFSLFGLNVAAAGLMFRYDAGPNASISISGGVTVMLTSKFQFGASIGGPGGLGSLTIDPATGATRIDTTNGLQIKGSLQLGSAFSADVAVTYRNVADTFSLDVSADVMLPQNVKVGGSFRINAGSLSSIALSFTGSIQIGTTGVFLTRLAGSLNNLDNPENLVVSGELGVSLGPRIKGVSVISASGGFTIDRNHLNITAHVDIVGGTLGSADGCTVDINWTTGVFQIGIQEISLLDGTFKFGGDLFFDRLGNITINAMASVNVPRSIPLIGGQRLASLNFYLQVRPGLPDDRTFGAAWTETIFGTIGFQIDTNFNVKVLTGAPSMDPVAGAASMFPERIETMFEFPVKDLTRTENLNLVLTSPQFALSQGQDGYLVSGSSFNLIRVTGLDANGAPIPVIGGGTEKLYQINGGGFGLPAARTGQSFEERVVSLDQSGLVGLFGNQVGRVSKLRVIVNRERAVSTGFAAPMGALAQNFAKPTITSTSFNRQPNGDINFTVSGKINNLDKSKSTISLYADDSVPEPEENPNNRNARLLETFTIPASSIGAGGSFTFTATNRTFLQLAPNPYQGPFARRLDFKLYVDVSDGFREAAHSNYSATIVPPDPSAALTLPAFFRPDTVESGIVIRPNLAPLTAVTYTLDGGGMVQVNGQTARSVRVATSVAGGGTFSLPVRFLPDSTFTGFTTLRVTAQTTLPSGQVYAITRGVPIATSSVQLLVLGGPNQNSPGNGDVTTIDVQLQNSAVDGTTATNAQVAIDLPATVSVVGAETRFGTYDTVRNIWFPGEVPPSAIPILTLKVITTTRTTETATVTTTFTSREFNSTPESARRTFQLFHNQNTSLAFDDTNLDGGKIQLPTTLVNAAYTFPVALKPGAGGAGGPYVYSVDSDAIPVGLSLSSDGILRGRATIPGPYEFAIRVLDRLGNQTRSVFRLGVADTVADAGVPITIPAFGLPPLPIASQTYNVVKGQLPPGLSLDPLDAGRAGPTVSFSVRGTPTRPGFYNFKLTRTIRREFKLEPPLNGTITRTVLEESRDFFVFVRPSTEAISPAQLPTIVSGQAFSARLSIPNATPTTRFLVSSGTLPNGLTLAPDGTLSGTFGSLIGPDEFTVTAVDVGGILGVRTYLPSYGSPRSLQFAQASLAGGSIGKLYFQEIKTTLADEAPFTYSLQSGSVPDGLTFSPVGFLSGIPTRQGTFTFTVRAVGLSLTGTRTYTVAVNPTLQLDPPTIAPALFANIYQQRLRVSGGSGTGYSLTVVGGRLPQGIDLQADPDRPGEFQFIGAVNERVANRTLILLVTDSAGATAARVYTIPIVTFPTAVLGSANSFELPPGTSIAPGSLPPGLRVEMAGSPPRLTIRGNPTAAGFFPTTIGTPGASTSEPRTFRPGAFAVAPRLSLSIFNAPVVTREVSVPSTVQLTARGGSGFGYTYSLQGALPPGWTLTPDGLLGGNAFLPGTYSFTIEVRDSFGNRSKRDQQVVVIPERLGDVTEVPTSIRTGVPYRGRIKGMPPQGDYAYMILEGQLPPGLALSPTTGEITGTRSDGGFGVSRVTFGIMDRQSGRTFRSPRIEFQLFGPIEFLDPPQGFNAGPAGFVTQLIRRPIGFTVNVTAEGVPDFLSISRTGQIRDTADLVAGSYPITLIVNDSLGLTTRKTFTFVVNDVPRVENINIVGVPGRSSRVNPVNTATDPENNAIRLDFFAQPENARVEMAQDGSLVITPDGSVGVGGVVQVFFTLADAGGAMVSRGVVLTAAAQNRPPVAATDSVNTARDGAIELDVLANDRDPDGNLLYLLSAASPRHGIVTIRGNKVQYVPAAGFVGLDSFQYVATDGLDTVTGTVRLKVGNPTVSFAGPASVLLLEGGPAPMLTLNRAGDLSEPLAVRFEVVAGATNPATLAGTNADVRVGPTTVTFQPGQGSLLFSPYSILDDRTLELRESLAVRLVDASGWDIGAARSVATTIRDNEVGELSFVGPATVAVREGATTPTTFTIRRTGDPTDPLRVSLMPMSGRPGATLSGVAADVRLQPLVANFAAGQSTATVTAFTVVDDRLVEPTESLSFMIWSAGGLRPGAAWKTTVQIVDNDPPAITAVQQVRTKGLVTSIIVDFNTTLDASQIAAVGSILLAGPGRDKRLGTADDVRIAITPRYVAGTNRLIIGMARPLPRRAAQRLSFPTLLTASGVSLRPLTRDFVS